MAVNGIVPDPFQFLCCGRLDGFVLERLITVKNHTLPLYFVLLFIWGCVYFIFRSGKEQMMFEKSWNTKPENKRGQTFFLISLKPSLWCSESVILHTTVDWTCESIDDLTLFLKDLAPHWRLEDILWIGHLQQTSYWLMKMFPQVSSSSSFEFWSASIRVQIKVHLTNPDTSLTLQTTVYDVGAQRSNTCTVCLSTMY